MYIFKNAWRNIVRNKGRNILIGIIILVIAFSSTITLAIRNTSSDLINTYQEGTKATATISISRGNMRQDFDFTNSDGMDNFKDAYNNIEKLTVEEIKKYAESKYVSSYYYTESIGLNSSNIEKVSSDFSFSIRNSNDNPDDADSSRKGFDKVSTDFKLIGYSSLESMQEFINGSYQINEKVDDAWNLVLDGYNCMINKELADLNDISINDTITLTDDDENDYDFTVVGIFEDTETSTESMFSNSCNNIITNANVIEDLTLLNDSLNSTLTPTFMINSYDDSQSFQDDLYSMGMNEYYEVKTNESELEGATSTITNVSSFATTFLVLTLVIGVIVLFVINQINIRERKYEIGVLRTIGMKKSTLSLQFMSELLMVTVIALLIGVSLGAISSKPISNYLLSHEINSSTISKNNIENNFGNKGNMPGVNTGNMNKFGIVNVQAYDSINAIVSFKTLLELLLIGVGLTLISSGAAVISIERFSPLEILKERG